jgi:hypothetical protein
MPTMGIVLVAFLAAKSAGVLQVTMTWTFRLTRSARRAGFSFGALDIRCSTTRFCPSTYPWSRRPCRNASVKFIAGVLGAVWRNPRRYTFPAGCASAASGAARMTPTKTSVSSRRV